MGKVLKIENWAGCAVGVEGRMMMSPMLKFKQQDQGFIEEKKNNILSTSPQSLSSRGLCGFGEEFKIQTSL